MGRLARVVAVDVPHHLTQRGNDRRFILDCDSDRATYLSLLRENIDLYGLSVMGYCLMSNHVHLIVVPSTADGLAQALKQTHGRYASYWNTVHFVRGTSPTAEAGWRSRYFSRHQAQRDRPVLVGAGSLGRRRLAFRGQTGLAFRRFVDRRDWHFRQSRLPPFC